MKNEIYESLRTKEKAKKSKVKNIFIPKFA